MKVMKNDEGDSKMTLGEGVARAAILLSATALWLNGFHNGWVIFMFVIGVL